MQAVLRLRGPEDRLTCALDPRVRPALGFGFYSILSNRPQGACRFAHEKLLQFLMTFRRQTHFLLGIILLSGAGHKTGRAQAYNQSFTPVQIEGIPGLSLSPMRPLPGFQPALAPTVSAPFSPAITTLAPAPVFEEPPSVLEPATPESGVVSLAPGVAEAPVIAPNTPRPATQLQVRLGGGIEATYDSNIFIQQNHAKSDLYFILAPTLGLGSGDLAESLDLQQQATLEPQTFDNADLIRLPAHPFYYLLYTPSYTAFVDHTDLNSFDNDVAGGAQITLRRLTLGAFARFQTFRAPDIEVGTRTREQWTSARAYALYALSDRTQLNADFFVQNRNVQNFISSLEVWNEDWIDYRYSTKTSVGAGIAAGLVIPSAGPDEYYGRIQVRTTWNATGRISVAAKAGLELRAASGAGAKLLPVFGLEGRYAITSRTSAAVSVYQQIHASAGEQATVYAGRGFDVSIQEKVLDRYLLGAAIGYTNIAYNSFMQAPGTRARNDNFVFVNVSAQTQFNRWVNGQLGLEFRKNQSSATGSSFNEFLGTWALRLKF